MRRFEVAFLMIIAASIVASFFIDDSVPGRNLAADEQSAGRFISTGWYCPSPGGDSLTATMSATNLGSDRVHLRRWAVGSAQTSELRQSILQPRRRDSIAIKELGIPDATGLAEAFGSDTTADLFVSSPGSGVASSRCSVQPWDHWYFSVASIERNSDTTLLVANPFDEEAVIRVRQLAPTFDRVPALLKELVVPKLSQLAVDLKQFIAPAREGQASAESFGLEVVATSGRVVVSRFSSVGVRTPPRGIALDVGVRAPAQRWTFAGGRVPESGEEQIVVVNPNDKEALVQVIFHGVDQQTSPPDLEEIAVPAGRQMTVVVSKHLPRGTAHGTSVVSTNGVPVVAERHTVSASPTGFDSTFGVPATATKWAISVGSPIGNSDAMDIVNDSQVVATVRVALITSGGEARPPELAAIQVEPGRHVSIDMSPFVQAGPATAIVEAVSGTIAVERHLVIGPPFNDFADSFGQVFE